MAQTPSANNGDRAASRRQIPIATATTRRRIIAAVARMHGAYGHQGWWPVRCERKSFANPQGQLESDGYHPGQFDFPRTRQGRWEICCGAVLTQNTAWTNVRRALTGLARARIVTPERMLRCPAEVISDAIRPAGYFNQKARYLTALAGWFLANDPQLSQAEPSRQLLERARPLLLAVRGVGPETADSILLYAYSLPTFVVDAYTRRVFGRLSLLDETAPYEVIRAIFEATLARPTLRGTVELWQEAHALVVEHAKRHHGRGGRNRG